MVTSTKIYNLYSKDEKKEVLLSEYGYWITPAGELIALLDEFTHGECVFIYSEELTTTLDSLLDEYDKFHQKYTSSEGYAVAELDWLRISYGRGEWNFSLPPKINKAQFDWLTYIAKRCGLTHEDVWENVLGRMQWNEFLRHTRDRLDVN